MKILAIRFARLGDVVLLLPSLSLLKRSFPDSKLTLLTGHRCAPLAELCPAVDEVMSVNRLAIRDGSALSAAARIWRLVRDVRRRHFDLVIDFHSFRETNLLAWVSGASARIGLKRSDAAYLRFCFNRPPVLEDKSLHVADMFRCVVTAVAGTAAADSERWLSLPETLRQWADDIGPSSSRLVLYVDAPVPERAWPPERFAALAAFAVERLGAGVIVISGNSGCALVERVRGVCRYSEAVSVFSNLTVPQLVALIASARVFVSNDTGPMHIGPAVGVPTLGLFSVGFPEHFRPLGPDDRFLRANPIGNIDASEVMQAVAELWAIADRGLRR